MPTHVAPRVLSWASILEESTLEQAARTAQLPFVVPHLALMPDAHLGKGATVGSVIPTVDAVIPAAVGVDIGCGMDAVLTQFVADELADPELRAQLRLAIERRIPLSAGRYNTRLEDAAAESAVDQLEELAARRAVHRHEQLAPNWRLQLGSLGSGNHFIEVSLDERDRVWLFLHSGSRGVGNRLAQHHIKVARMVAERYWITLPDPDLAYLVQGTVEFEAYMRDLEWAQAFAQHNRRVMMARVEDALAEATGRDVLAGFKVSCHHNYTARERHFGRDLIVSRKGAINAHEGVWGLIPGSMGAKSYVVRGKGNRASLCSAPHGAGRNHSRSAARKLFTLEDLEARMAGVEWSGSSAFLDEHPDAYKDIDVVMADAADLVEVVHTLRQIINVKGD